MKAIIQITAMSLILCALSACNTVHGFGQDMQQGGQEIQKAAAKS